MAQVPGARAKLAGHAAIEENRLGVVVGADHRQVAHQWQEALEVEAVDMHEVERTGGQLATERLLEGVTLVHVVHVRQARDQAARVVPDEPKLRVFLGDRKHPDGGPR